VADSGPDLTPLIQIAGKPKGGGGLMLAAWGIYGGQYAKMFPPEHVLIASWVCLIAAVLGAANFAYRLTWR
jgi:hypothetical protein